VTTFDGRATDHVMKFPRPSPSVFAYCKRSKTGGVEGLGMRLKSNSEHSQHLDIAAPLTDEKLRNLGNDAKILTHGLSAAAYGVEQ